MRKLKLYISSISRNLIYPISIMISLSCLSTVSLIAQPNEQVLGHWQLQKLSFKKTVAGNLEKDKEQFLAVFNKALYARLTAEQRLTPEDLEWTNTEAENLRDIYFQTVIEFKLNGAYYNTSQNISKSLSGEYLLDKKKLLMEWETADKTDFDILILTGSELVLKDRKLKIIYNYNRLQKKQADEISTRLKYEKDLDDTKPDMIRIAAQKAAEEKLKFSNQ
jgi:hypothetical protein